MLVHCFKATLDKHLASLCVTVATDVSVSLKIANCLVNEQCLIAEATTDLYADLAVLNLTQALDDSNAISFYTVENFC